MKQFSCGDVVPGCNATFQASSEDDVLVQVAAHAKRDHGMTEVSPDIATQVRTAIRDLPAGG